MIDGCLDEMRDERRAAWLALTCANQLKISVSNQAER
jgi:hypothetical protein